MRHRRYGRQFDEAGPGHNPTESFVEMLEGTASRRDSTWRGFCEVKRSLRENSSALRGVPQRIQRRRHRNLQEPDSGRHDLQHGEPAEGPGCRRSSARGSGRGTESAEGDAGYPPLVTPSSQIVGTQAVFNVLMGTYKVLTGEFADLMLGYYGSTFGEKDPEVLKRARSMRRSRRSHADRRTC